MKRNSSRGMLMLHMLIILACFAVGNAVQSDVDCLRSIKESLQDPENLLSSWDFSNNTEGHICGFTGVECWHPDESKVLNIRLSDMGLRGPFPLGVKNCTSLTGLDLSSNHLTGQLPSNVSDFMRFLTTLDLSSNNVLGPIPSSFCNLSFINVLRLNNNQLTGQIPLELAGLDRIKEFSVANNRLSGQVPNFRRNGTSTISADSYAGNLGLCGGPLDTCVWRAEKDLFLAGFAVGFPFFTMVTLLMIYYSPRLSMSNMRSFLLMVKKIKGREHDLISRSPGILLTEQKNTEESKGSLSGGELGREIPSAVMGTVQLPFF
ncbi:putative transferase [Helianthus debilis subsp. tardiflorus]